MRRILYLAAGLCVLLTMGLTWLNAMSNEFEAKAEQVLSDVGVADGVIATGKIGQSSSLTKGFGRLAKLQRPDEIQFKLASLTKPVTSAAIMHLVEQGKVSLADRVVTHLPELKTYEDPRIWDITLRDLMRHSGGIDDGKLAPPMFLSPSMLKEKLGLDAKTIDGCEVLAASVLSQGLSTPPARHYTYSNTGYCLLGQVVEAVTGKPLADAFVQLVPESLELTFDLSAAEFGIDAPISQQDFLIMQPKIVGAAGGFIGSIDGYEKFLQRAVDEDVFEVPDYATDASDFMGLGWRIWPAPSCPQRTHYGAMPGVFTVVVVADDGQFLIAFLDGRPEQEVAAFRRFVALACYIFEN